MKLLHSGYVKKQINIIAESGCKLLHLYPVCPNDINQTGSLIYRYTICISTASLSFHELNFYKIYGNDLPTPPKIVRTFQGFKDNLIN
ncbi:unnamed protein product [Rotaria magnacalcarata]